MDIHEHIDSAFFKRLVFKAVLLPLVLSVVLIFLFTSLFFKNIGQSDALRRSDHVMATSSETLRFVIDTETQLRGYLLSGQRNFLTSMSVSQKNFYSSLTRLKNELVTSTDQLEHLKTIEKDFALWLELAHEGISVKQGQSKKSEKELILIRSELMQELRDQFGQISQVEQLKKSKLFEKGEREKRESLVKIILSGLALGLVLALMSYKQLKDLSANYNEILKTLAHTTTHLEETVNLRTNDLLAVNKELEAFSYSVSHDLRAPLRGIDGFSQILMDEYGDKLDGEALRYLKFIRQGVQKMGSLIDDLINLSRLSRSELKAKNFDLSLLSQELFNELITESPERKVEFKNLEPTLVFADEGLMRVALQNLLSNAWKYTSTKDMAKIELGKFFKDGKDVFFIKDNGVGFDMRFYDKIFRPFQRLHSKEEFSGTGIGLATVARIIKRHGGTIWAEATVNEGATFYFTLS